MDIEKIYDLFEQELNDAYGDIDVCGYTYAAGHLLREIDPVAFETEAYNWADSMRLLDDDDDLDMFRV